MERVQVLTHQQMHSTKAMLQGFIWNRILGGESTGLIHIMEIHVHVCTCTGTCMYFSNLLRLLTQYSKPLRLQFPFVACGISLSSLFAFSFHGL